MMKMMKAGKSGSYTVWALALLVIPLCFLTVEETGLHHRISPVIRYLDRVTALTAYSLFALTFVLAARARWLERYFGGLDKMYRLHHRVALIAFVLMALHPFLHALRWVPQRMARFFMAPFPIHRELAVNLGSYALFGILFLLLFTLAFKLPYRIWKISHKFMGAFFVLALLHTFQLTVTFSENPLLWIYLIIISVFGLSAFIYQVFLFKVVNKGCLYKVDTVERITGRTLSIGISPVNEKIDFNPGQFCFFSFRHPGISQETHPYTLFRSGENDKIQLLVKSLGDYTGQLYSAIAAGAGVVLYGPYGCFVFSEVYKNQVWIAGGIGIAPFISWVRYLKSHPGISVSIRLYYCVHTLNDAVFIDELREFQERSDNFCVTLICTEERKRLCIDEIGEVKEKGIFLCGPRDMCKPMVKDLRRAGVLRKDIHYESFDF